MPIGLTISYGTAAGITEGKVIPELVESFDRVKAIFEHLHGAVQTERHAIQAKRSDFQSDMSSVYEMRTAARVTKVFVELDDKLKEEMIQGAKKLIALCDKY